MDAFFPYILPVALGIVLFFFPRSREAANHVETLFHELGHNLAATVPWILVGGFPSGIRIFEDGSGDGGSSDKLRIGNFKLATWLYFFGGYAFPLYAALALLVTASLGQSQLALIVVLGLCALAAMLMRNTFGFKVLARFSLFVVAAFAIPVDYIKFTTVVLLTVILLIAGLWDLLRDIRAVGTNDVYAPTNDFEILAQDVKGTRIGQVVKFLVFEGLILVAVVLPLIGWATAST